MEIYLHEFERVRRKKTVLAAAATRRYLCSSARTVVGTANEATSPLPPPEYETPRDRAGTVAITAEQRYQNQPAATFAVPLAHSSVPGDMEVDEPPAMIAPEAAFEVALNNRAVESDVLPRLPQCLSKAPQRGKPVSEHYGFDGAATHVGEKEAPRHSRVTGHFLASATGTHEDGPDVQVAYVAQV